MKVYPLIIDGLRKVTPRQRHVVNPATGDIVYSTAMGGVQEVDQAVESASRAQPQWEQLGAMKRGRILRTAAHLLRGKNLVDLETAATGRPIREYRAQLGRVPEWLEYHASLAETSEGSILPFADATDHVAFVRRRALGVCGLVTPFNHPLLIATKKVSVALATGNACVVKPSEAAPATVVELAECLLEAGLPPGVLNVVTGSGEAAARLASHDRVAKLDFTGGTKVGRLLGAAAGAQVKHYCAELGGNAPVVVFDDVDLREAVDGVAFAAFVASGQTCVSAKRILIHEPIFQKFVERLVSKADGLRMGDPFDEKTHIGPLISHDARSCVQAHVDKAREQGVAVLAGGGPPSPERCPLQQGSYFEPTVLANVDPTHACFQDEIFGPVVSVVPFRDEDHALSLANDNVYALGAAVYTSDLKRAHRFAPRLNAGVVWVNTHHRNAPDAPWGGFGHSGIGRENGKEAHREYTAPVTTILRSARDPEDWFHHHAGDPNHSARYS